MTTKELNDLLDERIAAVVEDLRKTANMTPVEFNGTVAGFLIKTGIHIAAANGCPNAILRNQVNATIKEAYRAHR